MKTETTKSIYHETSYVVGASAILILLSVIVFPLFILALPLVPVTGCTQIWHPDHVKGGRGKLT